jgi:hypothetical protein
MRRLHPAASYALKILVSAALLVFLLRRADTARLIEILYAAAGGYLLVAMLGYLVGQVLCSFRWALLASPLGFKNPFKDFLAFYFIGMFFNLFAPSTVGGDVGRVFYLARDASRLAPSGSKPTMASALISVVADRVVGLAVLVWIAAAALLLFPGYGLPATIRYATFAIAAATVACWFLVPKLSAIAARYRASIADGLRAARESYRGKGRVAVVIVLLSAVVHAIQALIQLALGWSLGLEIPWTYCFILYPLVGLFSAIPISFNGIGLREGGYLYLLLHIGVSSEKAIAFGILWFFIVVVDSLIGAGVFVMRRRPAAATAPAASRIR